jgi:hypothetical protein
VRSAEKTIRVQESVETRGPRAASTSKPRGITAGDLPLLQRINESTNISAERQRTQNNAAATVGNQGAEVRANSFGAARIACALGRRDGHRADRTAARRGENADQTRKAAGLSAAQEHRLALDLRPLGGQPFDGRPGLRRLPWRLPRRARATRDWRAGPFAALAAPGASAPRLTVAGAARGFGIQNVAGQQVSPAEPVLMARPGGGHSHWQRGHGAIVS